MYLKRISYNNFLEAYSNAFKSHHLLWDTNTSPEDVIKTLNNSSKEEFELFRTHLILEIFNFKTKNEIYELQDKFSANFPSKMSNDDIILCLELALDYIFKKSFVHLSEKFIAKNIIQEYCKIPIEINKLESSIKKLEAKNNSKINNEIKQNINSKIIQSHKDEIVRLKSERYLISNIKTNGIQTVSLLKVPTQGRKSCEYLNELLFLLRINTKDKYPTFYKKHIILPSLAFISDLFPEFLSKEEMFYFQNIENLDARIKHILTNISSKTLSMGEN